MESNLKSICWFFVYFKQTIIEKQSPGYVATRFKTHYFETDIRNTAQFGVEANFQPVFRACVYPVSWEIWVGTDFKQ